MFTAGCRRYRCPLSHSFVDNFQPKREDCQPVFRKTNRELEVGGNIVHVGCLGTRDG